MINLMNFEDYVHLVLESEIIFSQRNEKSSKYDLFSKNILQRIESKEKTKIEDKYCLVVNDRGLALELASKNNVLYIYMDNSEKIDFPKIKCEQFIPDINSHKLTNTSKLDTIISNYLNSKGKNENPIGHFDYVFNISIPIYEDKEHKHNYEDVAEINKAIFDSTILNNKTGFDYTVLYSLDDKDVKKRFYELLNKERSKDIIPEAIGMPYSKMIINDYGFSVADEMILTRSFVRSTGEVKADALDIEDERSGDGKSADGVLVGRVNPMIYCFKTANVNNKKSLKVGDTFRPIGVRMSEWRSVFNDLEHEDSWAWKAVEGNWIFRDHTVHKYLQRKDGVKRLNKKSIYEKYFTPTNPELTLENAYSNEFFLNVSPEDVGIAVSNIKKDIRENFDALRDSLKAFKENVSDERNQFFDERDLQKKAIDKFIERLKSNDDVKDMLIYAVMRFGKTYTAIRCLQEFYKIRTGVSNFSIISTAKTDVKNEWIGGFKKYLSDKIDQEGKRYSNDDVSKMSEDELKEKKFTDRTFEDFEIYDVTELMEKIKSFANGDSDVSKEFKAKYVGTYKRTKRTDGKKGYTYVLEAKEFIPQTYLKEGALEEYIRLHPDKKIVLFASLQDLGGSNDELKIKHKYFYTCPVDMLILDETHFAVRASRMGQMTGTAKNKYYNEFEELNDSDEEGNSANAEDRKLGDELNKLNLDNTIGLHLSGTPYNILKRKEFSEDDILAAFTFTHLMHEKEEWERINKKKRDEWNEIQEEKRNNGEKYQEEYENPYSVDKNPYFGIPKMIQYGYDLSKFEKAYLNDLKKKDDESKSFIEQSDAFEELFRVGIPETDTDGNVKFKKVDTIFYKKFKGKELPEVKFIHEPEVIALFRIIDGANKPDDCKDMLSILNIPEIQKGNMCKNILIALPFKDSCDALEELLKRTDNDGQKLFKILGEYKIINAAGRRSDISGTNDAIGRIRGMGEKTITLTSNMMLTGVTVEPWDTMFYMKDGSAPESYDQAKFRIQSPYINEIPLFDPDILDGKKPTLLKQDMKPQTLFIDFKMNRMMRLIDKQMEHESTIAGVTKEEYLKSQQVMVPEGDHYKIIDAAQYSDYINDAYAAAHEDDSYKRKINKIHFSQAFLNDDDILEMVSEFTKFANNEPDEPDEPESENEDDEGTLSKKSSKKGKGRGTTKSAKVKTAEQLKLEKENKIREEMKNFLNGVSIYSILRNDKEDNRFLDKNDILGCLLNSIQKPENLQVVRAVFFNNNFVKSDEECIDHLVKFINFLKNMMNKKNGMTLRGIESAISYVDGIMNNDRYKNPYEKVMKVFGTAAGQKLGKTEMISDRRLIEKAIESDFVIFNNGCKVLDAYGSKVGEFANYILNEWNEHKKGIVNPKNYYVLCYTPLVYELNKFILTGWGVPEKNIMFCNKVDDIENNIKEAYPDMIFDVIVGNPPYQGKGNPKYMQITKVIYDTNMDDNSVMCMINPTALVDNKYEGNTLYEKNKERYEYLKLIDFYYDPVIKGTFTSAEIGNDIGIFTYKKVKDEDKSLYSTWVKDIRFGAGFNEQKKIADKIRIYQSMKSFSGYANATDGNDANREEILGHQNKKYYVVTSYNRGHQDKKTGGVKWDWTTLLNDINLIVQTTLINKRWNLFGFDDYDEAVKWIKWFNTDFIQFLVLFYKTQMSNNPVLYTYLPQPPASGDFSDESLMKEFDLDDKQMKIIHSKFRGDDGDERNSQFGWKTKTNSYFKSDYDKVGYKLPSIELDGTEETLLEFIDELNRINKGVKINTDIDTDELLGSDIDTDENLSSTSYSSEEPVSAPEDIDVIISDSKNLYPDEFVKKYKDRFKNLYDRYSNLKSKFDERHEDDETFIVFNYWLVDQLTPEEEIED